MGSTWATELKLNNLKKIKKYIDLKLSHQVKVLSTKSHDLSLSPEIHMMEIENQLKKTVL